MKTPFLPFFAAFLLSLAPDAFAVPGPLISGGAWLISAAGALFALFAGFLAMGLSFLGARILRFRTSRPRTFRAAVGLVGIFAILVTATLVRHVFPARETSPLDRLRANLAGRAETVSEAALKIPLQTILANVEIPKKPGGKFSDTRLEEEIAYSIGRNNNVVWNRYLSSEKVPSDEKTFEAIRSGGYEIPLSRILGANGPSSEYEIVDLRTPLEFSTSAHFKGAKNVEYRSVVNDEAPLDRAKTHVFVCHDGAADLSRSLIATAYLRSKGYSAYALDTGMRPILERLWIPPAAFSEKTDYRVFDSDSPAPEGVVVDVLGALSETLAKRGYPPGYRIDSFPFYRTNAEEYARKMENLRAQAKTGGLNFACYDTFSCFYARTFVESLKADSATAGIAIFR